MAVTREVRVPPLVERPELRSVSDLLAERLARAPHHVAFGRRRGGELHDVTLAQFDAEVRELAKGLIAAGLRPGESVAIMSATRYEWAVADFAVWAAGGVVVPVYDTAALGQVRQVVAAVDARIALAAGPREQAMLHQARPELRVWTFDAGAGDDLRALASLGTAVPDADVAQRTRLAGPDDLASIVFTSGTTGTQKGVRITHGNFVRLVVQVAAAYREVVHDQASTVLFLPLAHVLAQGLQLVSVHAGMKVVHEGDPKAAVAAMAQVRPTFMVVVPRVLERIRAAARAKARARRLGGLFARAERVAVAWGEHLERAQGGERRAPIRLAAAHLLFDAMFFRRLRRLMGGRVDHLLSGASALDADLGNFFRGAGVPVLEGYGLTETTAPVTGNRPGAMRAGTVGVPIPGSTVRIADDGEVLVRGVGVSPGYLLPGDDADAFVDGFYRTGDLGSLDADGYLRIHGRLKNLLVTSNGKNVAPEPWEAAVSADPLVAQAVMVGEGRPHVAALIVLDEDAAADWARDAAPDLVDPLGRAAASGGPGGVRVSDPRLVARIAEGVRDANAAVSRAEQVRRFTVLAARLSEADATLTPTLKLRRDAFLAAASQHLDDLYTEQDAS